MPSDKVEYVKTANTETLYFGRTALVTTQPPSLTVALLQGPVLVNIEKYPIEKHESRFLNFTEECTSWRFPVDEVNLISDIAVSHGMSLILLVFSSCTILKSEGLQ